MLHWIHLILPLALVAAAIALLYIQYRNHINKHVTFRLWLHNGKIVMIRNADGEAVLDPQLNQRISELFSKLPAPKGNSIKTEYYPERKRLEVV